MSELTICGKLHLNLRLADLLESFHMANTSCLPEEIRNLVIDNAHVSLNKKKDTTVFQIDIVDRVLKLGFVSLDRLSLTVVCETKYIIDFCCRFPLNQTTDIILHAQSGQDRWLFDGGLPPGTTIKIDEILQYLTKNCGANHGAIQIPDEIKAFKINTLRFLCDSKKNLTFLCSTQFALDRTALDMELTIGHDAIQNAFILRSVLQVGQYPFELRFLALGGASSLTCFCAAYCGTEALSLPSLLSVFSGNALRWLPHGFTLALDTASFLFLKSAEKTRFLLTARLGLDFDLRSMPVLGEQLPANIDIAVQSFVIRYLSDDITKEETALINPVCPPDVPLLLDSGCAAGFVLQGEIRIANSVVPLTLDLGGSAESAARSTQPMASDAPNVSSTIKWISLQKQLGPVYFARIGVRFADHVLSFLMDASLYIPPFAFTVNELSLGSRIDKFALTADLRGFELSYNSPALSISGSIMQVPVTSEDAAMQFDGSLSVQTGRWGFVALASYAQLKNGTPSLFIFLDANIALGGPPYFTITGLLGGMGINRRLVFPGFDEVSDFPLLQMDTAHTPGEMLRYLSGEDAPAGRQKKKWLTLSKGDYWIAAGVKFTSFELIKGKLMLSAKFGRSDMEIALLGIASMTLPKKAALSDAFVYVELQMSAVLNVDKGQFIMGGTLTPASFLISRDCHLQGGFAFCFWFGQNPNAGQFVLTIGGYHPRFTPPAHYPAVDRVGFNWRVDTAVTVKGDAYLAITPSCAMAGGSLEVEYKSGGLRAWFTAYAHFLMAWSPFSFLAEMGVEIGVSYTFDFLWTAKTLSFRLGADLLLWGPPTGGIVTIDLGIICFSVSFGVNRDAGVRTSPLLWDEFMQLLPPKEELCTVMPGRGLRRVVEKDGVKHHVVSGKDFTCFTSSAIPYATSEMISIRPMNLNGTVRSTHTVSVTLDGETYDINYFNCEVISSPVPESLWGKPLTTPSGAFTHIPSVPSAAVIHGLNTGLQIAAPPPALNGGFVVENYSEKLKIRTNAALPITDAPRSSMFKPVQSEAVFEQLQRMSERSALEKRTQICLALQDYFSLCEGSFTLLSAQAGGLFRDRPMVSKP